ncbi:TlpA family protein disulfide reductase [Bacillus sp. Bva_UNVM-123]|uniref:TlpA disulfide reductase family protein n=1 Tax=Bacillus sp. Bva_UNVM-123 TaxID=2829798 RepID=UPI00391F25DD
MIKKIAVSVFIMVLMTVMIVQAMGKEEQKVKNTEKHPGLGIGLKAPDFELKNLAGESVKLSDYEGKKVMLNFWATWCPPCKAEMPDMEEFYHDSGDDIVILAVNIDTNNDVAGFVKKMGVTFPILLDTNNRVNKIYQIISIPTSYFIDEKGIIRNKHIGAMDIETMKKNMDI